MNVAIIVPITLTISSLLMALAWLGHVRFRHKRFIVALMVSWLIVLPEYVLNVTAIRWGHGTFTGGEMAAFNLCSGVFCVALVSRLFLKEVLAPRQILGFVIMALGMILVVY